MTGNRGGTRFLSALLAFVLLGSLGLAFDAPGSRAAPEPAHAASTGGPQDTGGAPGVLPPPSRIHVLVNRPVDGPGAPSYAAAAVAPPAVAHPGDAGRETTTEPQARNRPTAGSFRGRAPPHTPV
jgi:hypothetical protein